MHTVWYDLFSCKKEEEIRDKMNDVYKNIMSDSSVDYCEIGSVKKIYEIAPSLEEAEKILRKKFDDDEYSSYLIKYKRKRSAKLKNLEERLEKEEEKLKDFEKKSNVRNHKSKSIGCTGCESKISISYIKDNICPVCGNDLRSKTDLNRISTYKKNIRDLKIAVEDEKSKQKRTSKDCETTEWLLLVAYDYHS